jgi:hypothetical protein
VARSVGEPPDIEVCGRADPHGFFTPLTNTLNGHGQVGLGRRVPPERHTDPGVEFAFDKSEARAGAKPSFVIVGQAGLEAMAEEGRCGGRVLELTLHHLSPSRRVVGDPVGLLVVQQ